MARVFVCHAKLDVEAGSEVIDLLEIALELPQGALTSSSLPGYAPATRSDGELREQLRGSNVMLALATAQSVRDADFCFELGAAWGMGLPIIPLLLGTLDESSLPWPLRGLHAVRPHDRAAWQAFVQDMSVLLSVRARAASEARIALDEIARSPVATPSEPAPEQSEIYTLPKIAGAPRVPAARGVGAHDAASAAQLDAFALSCARAFEAGRAISDCAFNRDEALDFARELEEPFGKFVDALGGSWQDLRKLGDFDVWLGVTDNLLQALPDSQRTLSIWYGVGFELATLHNLAGRGAPGSSDDRAELDAVWQEALDRFLAFAESARIRYEHLAPVISWLSNLIGPQAERDYTNVARTLAELRRHASQADLHHAA